MKLTEIKGGPMLKNNFYVLVAEIISLYNQCDFQHTSIVSAVKTTLNVITSLKPLVIKHVNLLSHIFRL